MALKQEVTFISFPHPWGLRSILFLFDTMLGGVVSLSLFVICIFFASAQPFGPPAKLWPSHFVVPLHQDTFDSVIRDAHKKWVLVEFYANFCPHCKQLAPEYEKLGYIFNRDNDSPLLVAKIDCWENQATGFLPVCGRYKINGFPRIFLAPTDVWLSGDSVDSRRVHARPLRAYALLHYANSVIGAKYTLPDPGYFSTAIRAQLDADPSVPGSVSAAVASTATSHQTRMPLWDIEVATAMAFDFIFKGQPRYGEPLTPEKRAFFVDFLGLLTSYYPDHACRPSLRTLQAKLPRIWPPYERGSNLTYISPSQVRDQFSLCDRKDWLIYEKTGWRQCEGSYSFTRGFTCGLWQLFHGLVAHASDSDALKVLRVMRQYVDVFFKCTECRTHFLKGSVGLLSDPPEPRDVLTRRGAALWLWRKHNTVNYFVGKADVEIDFSGDPAYPKQQWPPVELCPRCWVDDASSPTEELSHEARPSRRTPIVSPPSVPSNKSRFDDEHVFRFLMDYYGAGSESTAAAAKSGRDARARELGRARAQAPQASTQRGAQPAGEPPHRRPGPRRPRKGRAMEGADDL